MVSPRLVLPTPPLPTTFLDKTDSVLSLNDIWDTIESAVPRSKKTEQDRSPTEGIVSDY